MRDYLSKALFGSREGLIFVIASAIYVAIGVSAELSPVMASEFGFIGMMSLFMPGFLLIFFLKIGGHRRNYLSTWFNTSMMLIFALVPFLVVAKSAIIG
ncbi:hypothetical protein [Methylomonas sp. DH-1]|uniref:hypothetical protein n=1 Tax=Methylomonas sp. (strain DH-1) TaxID=1727196 RepID=UPI0007C93B4A|nr:hypothetical protein [Methylomonas sp. DH-1]ANE54519.1 hypothetical protein AYM39_04505 [Methylomonas sp. DH-1]